MTQDAILHMRIAHEFRDMLDALRKAERDLPSRSEMVRRLIERAAVRAATRARTVAEKPLTEVNQIT